MLTWISCHAITSHDVTASLTRHFCLHDFSGSCKCTRACKLLSYACRYDTSKETIVNKKTMALPSWNMLSTPSQLKYSRLALYRFNLCVQLRFICYTSCIYACRLRPGPRWMLNQHHQHHPCRCAARAAAQPTTTRAAHCPALRARRSASCPPLDLGPASSPPSLPITGYSASRPWQWGLGAGGPGCQSRRRASAPGRRRWR
jgi:hypothetical protein